MDLLRHGLEGSSVSREPTRLPLAALQTQADAAGVQAVAPKLEVVGIEIRHSLDGRMAVVARQLAGGLGEFAVLVALNAVRLLQLLGARQR